MVRAQHLCREWGPPPTPEVPGKVATASRQRTNGKGGCACFCNSHRSKWRVCAHAQPPFLSFSAWMGQAGGPLTLWTPVLHIGAGLETCIYQIFKVYLVDMPLMSNTPLNVLFALLLNADY